MAIYQKERNIQSILRDIEVDTIPAKFVSSLTCFLRDGTVFTLSSDEFASSDDADDSIEAVVRDLEFFEMLSDLNIQIDYDKVEKDVTGLVSKILDKPQTNDPSDTSV